MKRKSAIEDLLRVMAKLRSPRGCPWDREQTHLSLRRHAIEEVYELIDAIESRDDHEMAEELGDVLMQVVFHAQVAKERGAFDFEKVCRALTEKLIRRHPHVFGKVKVKNVDEVWVNWEKIKRSEKMGSKSERKSAFDGIPKHLPALLRAERLWRKAQKANLIFSKKNPNLKFSRVALAKTLFDLAAFAQSRGWCAEELLAGEIRKQERQMRRRERG